MNNLSVALIPRINCRLLANEKTDSDYNVQQYNAMMLPNGSKYLFLMQHSLMGS